MNKIDQPADNALTKEQKSLSLLSIGFGMATVSGLLAFFVPYNYVWLQWTILLHVGAGLFMISPFILHLSQHFKRTLGQRRPSLVVSGALLAIIAGAAALSGLYLGVFGQMESQRWIYHSHAYSSLILVSVLALHLVLHRLRLSPQRRQSSTLFPSMSRDTFRATLVSLASGAGVVVVATVGYQLSAEAYLDQNAINPYQLPYGDHPFRPSQTETMSGGFLDARRLSGSHQCGVCHEEITREWRASMHAQAASDKSYQTNINLLAKKKGMASTRYCEGCHAPVALLSGQLTEGGRLDTTGHMQEGVGCVGCHGIDQVIHLQGVGSYRAAPKNDYLFAHNDGYLQTKIHNYLIKIQPRSHRNDMSRPVIADPAFCATCHTQFMDRDMNSWGWIKMQDEYTAWLNSPYSQQSDQEFSYEQIKRCQDCHFPLLKIDDPSANKNGLVRSHRSLGANTAIPWLNDDKEQLSLTKAFLRENKIRINIEEPNRVDATKSEMYTSPKVLDDRDAPGYFYLNEEAKLNLVVTNTGVGHNFPGGTTDINEVWLHVRVVDGQNQVIYESGQILDNNEVDPTAYFYRSLAVDRNGKHVWRHDLFNMIGDSYKNTIAAGESDIVEYRFNVPSWAKSPLSISAEVKYRKFNNRYARWALQDDRIELPVTDVARDNISVPLRIKKKVEANS